MTDKEKSKAVSDFCDGFFDPNEKGCFGCPLGKDAGECTDRSDEENYDILVKAGLIAPDDEVKTENDEIKRKAEQAFADASHKLSTVMRDIVDETNKNAVNHPNHYTKGGIECINAIKASMTSDGFMDYCKGNIIKYIWRWRDKGGIEDLQKTKVYLDWLIEAAKGCQNGQE